MRREHIFQKHQAIEEIKCLPLDKLVWLLKWTEEKRHSDTLQFLPSLLIEELKRRTSLGYFGRE